MCDGEIVAENSPFHHYLKSIGYTDTEIISRPPSDVTESRDTTTESHDVTAEFRDVTGLLKSCVVGLFEPSQVDLTKLRDAVKPHLLSIHRDHVGSLEEEEEKKRRDVKKEETSQLILCCIVVVGAGVMLWLLGNFVFSTLAVHYQYTISTIAVVAVSYVLWHHHHHHTPSLANLLQHTETLRKFKTTSKLIISFLRDCQIAHTPFAGGVTWSKLDNIEESGALVHRAVRELLVTRLRESRALYRSIMEDVLREFKMIADVDCRARYLSCQEEEEEEEGHVTSASSHVIRYNLKLVEHLSSELLWKFCVGCFPGCWPSGRINAAFISSILRSIDRVTLHFTSVELEIRHAYQTLDNSYQVELTAEEEKGNTQLLHQLQVLHSTLHIATIRCRETHKSAVHDAHLLHKSISQLKVSLDLAQTTLQSLEVLCSAGTVPAPELQTVRGEETLEACEAGAQVTPIVPYTQHGNMVFTAVNDDEGDLEPSYSDDEFEVNLRQHKLDSRMMLQELKHVIDTQPTCLYEDDYQDFKKTGLLNPTKHELKTMFENGSGDEEEEEEEERESVRRIGFNPFAMPMPNSLLNELGCATGETFGDSSSEEETSESRDIVVT